MTLDEYFQHSEGQNQLFLSFIWPYVKVSNLTDSRWIKEILKLAKTDVTLYEGHSTWVASTSKT